MNMKLTFIYCIAIAVTILSTYSAVADEKGAERTTTDETGDAEETTVPEGEGAETEDDSAAKEAFAEATILYNAGDFELASQKFNEAYALKPSWKLYYNIGQAEVAAKRQGLAIEAFEKYLTEGGDDIPMARRDEVLKEVERLRLIVGSVQLESPAGFGVFVDGAFRGKTPLVGSMRISASQEHLIELKDGSTVIDAKAVQVAGRENVVVHLGAGAVPSEGAAASQPALSATLTPAARNGIQKKKLLRQSKILKIIGWTSLGVGGGLALIGIIGAADAARQKKENDKSPCAVGDVDCEQKVADQELQRDTSLGVFGIGVLAMVAAPILLVVSKKKARRANALQTALLPTFSPGYSGVTFQATF